MFHFIVHTLNSFKLTDYMFLLFEYARRRMLVLLWCVILLAIGQILRVLFLVRSAWLSYLSRFLRCTKSKLCVQLWFLRCNIICKKFEVAVRCKCLIYYDYYYTIARPLVYIRDCFILLIPFFNSLKKTVFLFCNSFKYDEGCL